MIHDRTANQLRPTAAFVGASWAVLAAGIVAFLIGLWNANLQLNEKGFYFAILLFGLFSAVSLQKTVRDRIEGLPVTNIYYGLCWTACVAAVVLLTVGLWNANLLPSEKGFYAMSFVLANFAVVTVQKNVRDLQVLGPPNPKPPPSTPQPDSAAGTAGAGQPAICGFLPRGELRSPVRHDALLPLMWQEGILSHAPFPTRKASLFCHFGEKVNRIESSALATESQF